MIIDASKRAKRRMEAAQGYLMLDLPDQALSELEEIAASDERTFDYHLLRGEALRSKTEHRAALDAFHLALEIRPADLSALMGLAWCFKRTGQLDRSIETMLRAGAPAVPTAIALDVPSAGSITPSKARRCGRQPSRARSW